MHHIFVHVVKSGNDTFAGVRASLEQDARSRIIDVRFSDEEFEYIRQVEYSDRKFFRLFYYPRIFRSLEKRLDEALAGLGGDPANVYFSDEGVWALVWAQYRRRLDRTRVRAINVQHGFAFVEPSSRTPLRRFANAVSRLIMGYPTFGYGSLAGAGAEPFDLYLTYDQPAATHIVETAGVAAIAAPALIKYELMRDFVALLADEPPHRGLHALFALNIQVRGSPIKCDSVGVYDKVLPLAVAFRERGVSMSFRLHPGLDAAEERIAFDSHPISDVATLDDSSTLNHALARADIVLSLLSTVLWEGGLLGLVPVQVKCACCTDVDLGYPRQIVSMDADYVPQVDEIVRAAALRSKPDFHQLVSQEWAQVEPLLALDR